MRRNISQLQISILRNLAEGRAPLIHARCPGQLGNGYTALYSLERRKLVDRDFALTEQGRRALKKAKA